MGKGTPAYSPPRDVPGAPGEVPSTTAWVTMIAVLLLCVGYIGMRTRRRRRVEADNAKGVFLKTSSIAARRRGSMSTVADASRMSTRLDPFASILRVGSQRSASTRRGSILVVPPAAKAKVTAPLDNVDVDAGRPAPPPACVSVAYAADPMLPRHRSSVLSDSSAGVAGYSLQRRRSSLLSEGGYSFRSGVPVVAVAPPAGTGDGGDSPAATAEGGIITSAKGVHRTGRESAGVAVGVSVGGVKPTTPLSPPPPPPFPANGNGNGFGAATTTTPPPNGRSGVEPSAAPPLGSPEASHLYRSFGSGPLPRMGSSSMNSSGYGVGNGGSMCPRAPAFRGGVFGGLPSAAAVRTDSSTTASTSCDSGALLLAPVRPPQPRGSAHAAGKAFGNGAPQARCAVDL